VKISFHSSGAMLYLWLKAFHIVGVVSWFAGLFYHGRLLVYHAEALASPEPRRGILTSQYQLMESRLFRIIMNPAMGITLVTAAAMLVTTAGRPYLTQPWMLAKLVLVALLVAFHFWMRRIMLQLAEGRAQGSGEVLRLLNEVPTLVLVLVTILAVFKTGIPWGGLGAAGAVLVVAIPTGIRVYGWHRRRNGPPRSARHSEES
jgi:protoporphyrinogen IX oxidase